MKPYPSLFDRLLDQDANPQRYTLQQYKEAVLGDLLELLNTIAWAAEQEGFSQQPPIVRESILGYGVPPRIELRADDAGRARLASQIKLAIGLYEPRLTEVTVKPSRPPAGDPGARLHFTISATIKVDQGPFSCTMDDFSAGVAMTLNPERFDTQSGHQKEGLS